MQTFLKFKIFLLSLILLFIACFFGIQQPTVFADSAENVSGWAWNSGIGWIKFNNCLNSVCDAIDYGVKIEVIGTNKGNFSGYAWNDNVGWISFQENTLPVADGNNNTNPDYDFNSNCDTATCNTVNNCTACYNSTDNKVYGYAKILSMGNDGWIKFTNTTGSAYDTKIVSGEMSGWAYNEGSSGAGIGWISFNCIDTAGLCAISNYKVSASLNNPPTISDMTAPNWGTNDQICAKSTVLTADLKWKYNDDSLLSGTAYQVDVTGSDGSTFSTGKCLKSNGVTGNCTINFTANPNQFCPDNDAYCTFTLNKTIFPQMTYGITYNWIVTVWDDQGQSNTVIANGPSFTTYISEFPKPVITYPLPANYNVDQEVPFDGSGSKYYIGNTENICDVAHCTWEWNSPQSNFDFVAPDTANTISPILKFTTSEPGVVELTITDNATGYNCLGSTPSFNIKQKLPNWIETKK